MPRGHVCPSRVREAGGREGEGEEEGQRGKGGKEAGVEGGGGAGGEEGGGGHIVHPVRRFSRAGSSRGCSGGASSLNWKVDKSVCVCVCARELGPFVETPSFSRQTRMRGADRESLRCAVPFLPRVDLRASVSVPRLPASPSRPPTQFLYLSELSVTMDVSAGC